MRLSDSLRTKEFQPPISQQNLITRLADQYEGPEILRSQLAALRQRGEQLRQQILALTQQAEEAEKIKSEPIQPGAKKR